MESRVTLTPIPGLDFFTAAAVVVDGALAPAASSMAAVTAAVGMVAGAAAVGMAAGTAAGITDREPGPAPDSDTALRGRNRRPATGECHAAPYDSRRQCWSIILVADDGSDAALKAVEFAAELAAKMGASLTALAVIDSGNFGAANVLAVARSEGLEASAAVGLLVDAAAEYLARCWTIAQRHGVVRFHSEKPTGDDPATGILDFAREHAIDLIVVGSRGIGRLPGLLLGSVSQKHASLAPCSVLIAR
jgi:nucleotide-binding universal stress UspA family protein